MEDIDIRLDTDTDVLEIALNAHTAKHPAHYPGLTVFYDSDGHVCAVHIDNASTILPTEDWLTGGEATDALEVEYI